VEIEQLLDGASARATATLADETLVDYLAAKLRGTELSNEKSAAKSGRSSQDDVTSPVRVMHITAVNVAIMAELDENHRFAPTGTFSR